MSKLDDVLDETYQDSVYPGIVKAQIKTLLFEIHSESLRAYGENGSLEDLSKTFVKLVDEL